jgi:hypothetical protein
MLISRRYFFAFVLALAGVFTIGLVRPGEIKKRNITDKEASEWIQSLSQNIYLDAKKYGVNFGEETPETVFKSILPDAKSILQRRFLISD